MLLKDLGGLELVAGKPPCILQFRVPVVLLGNSIEEYVRQTWHLREHEVHRAFSEQPLRTVIAEDCRERLVSPGMRKYEIYR